MRRCVIVAIAALMLAPSCRRTPGGDDQASRQATTGKAQAARLISFSPALTSLLFEMGLGERVVGVTAYCQLPPSQGRPVAGDRHNINAERIVSLQPDAILIQQDERDFDLIRRVAPQVAIEHFTIEKLQDIAAAMERIGRIVGDEQLGLQRRAEFEGKLSQVRRSVEGLARPRVLFLTGLEPPSVAGKDSFIHELIELAGGLDTTARYERWTQINVERMIAAQPEVIFCQVPAGAERQAREYLQGLPDMPASARDRIFILTDRRWTVPSAYLADLAGELAGMIHPQSNRGGERD